MTAARVTAVVVTFNSEKTIADTLETAERCHQAGLLDCVIVDNDSGDGTVAYIESRHPWATLVRSPANLGFGRGCNLGFERVTTSYVLFLNPDAAVEPEDLRTLLAFMESNPSAGIVAPSARTPEGTLHHHRELPTPWKIVRSAFPGPLQKSYGHPLIPGLEPFRVVWVPGAIMLFRSSIFRTLGGFDPRFFLYFEETDLFKRAADLGLEVWAVTQAVGRHLTRRIESERGARHEDIAEHFFRSRFYYLVKHHGALAACSAELAELVLLALRAAFSRLLLRPGGQLSQRLKGPVFQLPKRVEPAASSATGPAITSGSR